MCSRQFNADCSCKRVSHGSVLAGGYSVATCCRISSSIFSSKILLLLLLLQAVTISTSISCLPWFSVLNYETSLITMVSSECCELFTIIHNFLDSISVWLIWCRLLMRNIFLRFTDKLKMGCRARQASFVLIRSSTEAANWVALFVWLILKFCLSSLQVLLIDAAWWISVALFFYDWLIWSRIVNIYLVRDRVLWLIFRNIQLMVRLWLRRWVSGWIWNLGVEFGDRICLARRTPPHELCRSRVVRLFDDEKFAGELGVDSLPAVWLFGCSAVRLSRRARPTLRKWV